MSGGLAACSGDSAGTATSTSPPAAAQVRKIDTPACLPKGARAVVAGPKDAPTIVVTAGKGDHGIVFAPQSGTDFCDWVGQFTRYTDAGYHVASFSWAADGKTSITSAVDVLRGEGALGVVLVGASKGAAFVADMADALGSAPLGVIALSPPTKFQTADATSANSKYTGPLLVVATVGDAAVPAAQSKLVARPDDPSTYLELSGGAHGVAMFLTPARAELEGRMDTFMTSAFASR